jgi:cyclophilin family peptidyl-prolyl cis-trans isomerase
MKTMKKHRIVIGIGGLIVLGIVSVFFLPKNLNLFTSLFSNKMPETVILQTNHGNIEIKLLAEEAPNLVKNFVELAKAQKYDNSIFHRVIEGFMIQGGDYENNNGTGGNSWKNEYLEDEFSENLSHVRGAVSMANKGPDTNGSQFFIVQQDSTFLDGRHSIFGQVTKGMNVVDKIAGEKTDLNDAPLKKVVLEKVILK